MTERDNQNNEIITRLIRDYFSLSSESYNRFKNALETPPMVEPIKKLFNESNDYRIKFDLGIEQLEDFDQSWGLFRERFKSFVLFYEMTYSDFINNKITINKNKIKLKKALLNFYSSELGIDNCSEFVYDHEESSIINKVRQSYRLFPWEKDIDFCIVNNLVRFTSKEELFNYLKEKLEKKIMKVLEEIGASKVSNKHSNLQVVLTRNFSDWFMCSTAEKTWTSCLNLTSDYEGAFWSGLPGLIVDSNRIMIYITDGKTKSFRGIETERFLQRSWVVIDNEEIFHNLKWYDSKKISNKTIRDITGLNLSLNSGKDFVSFSKFEPLWFNNGMSCFAYHDNSQFSEYEDGVYIQGTSDCDMCIIDSHNRRHFESVWNLDDDAVIEDGLLTLIELNISIAERQEGYGTYRCCAECGDEISPEEEFMHDGDVYCERCYTEEFAECEHCGSVYRWDNGRIHSEEIDGNIFCDNCSDDYVVIDGLWYHEDNICRVYDEDGEGAIKGFFNDKQELINLRYNFNFSVDSPEDFVYVKEYNMYFPEEMCVKMFSNDDWWTMDMIKKYSDQYQYKLDLDLRTDEERDKELLSDVTNHFMDFLKEPRTDLPDSLRIVSSFIGSSWMRNLNVVLNGIES